MHDSSRTASIQASRLQRCWCTLLSPAVPLALILLTMTRTTSAQESSAAAPTSEETAILQMLNRYRSDWAAGDARIMAAIRSQEIPAHEWEWRMVQASSGSSAPLVFNAKLNAIAHQLISPPVTLTDRKRYDASSLNHAAGYAPEQPNLVMLGLNAPSLMVACELALTTAIGEIPAAGGTTDAVFARAEAVKPEFREAGIALIHQKNTVSVVVVLGAGAAAQYLGGIAFLDSNRDHRYGPTEGVSGVQVTCGAMSMTTGASGAWWLTADSTESHRVTFSKADQTQECTTTKGAVSEELCWRMPVKADLKLVDRLLPAAEKEITASDERKVRLARIRLLMGTRMAILDQARQARCALVSAPVRDDFLSSVHDFKATLNGDPDEILASYGQLQKTWSGALPAWFAAARHLVDTHAQVTEYLSSSADHQQSTKSAVIEQLTACLANPGDPLFLEEYLVWLEEVDRAAYDALGPIVAEPTLAPPAH